MLPFAGIRFNIFWRPAGWILNLPTFPFARRHWLFAAAIWRASLTELLFPSTCQIVSEARCTGGFCPTPMESRTVHQSESEYAEVCLPNDANLLGNMLGGHVMHLVDLCGAIAGMRHARCTVVTASIDQMTFLHPIRIGELVRLKSVVNRVFRTSMEVGVEVWVENLHTAEIRHTSSAYLTFVGLDAGGESRIAAANCAGERRRKAPL